MIFFRKYRIKKLQKKYGNLIHAVAKVRCVLILDSWGLLVSIPDEHKKQINDCMKDMDEQIESIELNLERLGAGKKETTFIIKAIQYKEKVK